MKSLSREKEGLGSEIYLGLIVKMGRKIGMAIASAAAIGITALVLDTNLNPAAVANVIGAKCEMQKEIRKGYGYAKIYYTLIKDSLLRQEKGLAGFEVWSKGVEAYLRRCYYLEEHRTII